MLIFVLIYCSCKQSSLSYVLFRCLEAVLTDNIQRQYDISETISSGKPSPPDEVLIDILSCVTDAFCSLRRRKDLNDLKPSLVCQIFDSMISPILTYNNEVWGAFVESDFNSWDSFAIEKFNSIQFNSILYSHYTRYLQKCT